jgi:hypothetical protein
LLNTAKEAEGGPTTLENIRDYLASLHAGPVSDSSRLQSLLASCWKVLSKDVAGGMETDILYDRMESILWEPPRLTFIIARHGGSGCGSTRAELQQWTVDINRGSASFVLTGYRQLRAAQAKLDVLGFAQKIATLILRRQVDDRLKWSPNGQVRVLVGAVLPEDGSFKKTREGRRRRFRRALEAILASNGWKKCDRNTYCPPEHGHL